MTPASLESLPFVGSGLGYRAEIRTEIFAARGAIDCLEVIADQYLTESALPELAEICASFPVIVHGIGLSVGSIAPADRAYLRALRRVLDLTGSPYLSEHLAMTRAPGINVGHLSPLWFTDAVLRVAIDNVQRAQDELGRPLALENVTYLFDIPKAEMRQTEFFARLVEATGCGVLLDVTNLVTNSVNHGFDPLAFLGEMPIDHIVQVHLAGGRYQGELLLDTHSGPVAEETWELLAELAAKTRLKGSILEHDADFPPSFSVLLAQVERAREILDAPRQARPRRAVRRVMRKPGAQPLTQAAATSKR